jgi:hypothetical protein
MKTEVHPTGEQLTAEDLQVFAWRHSQLVAAGLDSALAEELACSASVDLHALIELIERGCPAELAARILAPLDGERRLC